MSVPNDWRGVTTYDPVGSKSEDYSSQVPEETSLHNRIVQLERRCTVLEDELSASRSAVVKLTDSVKDQRIDELVEENGRLRHRLQLIAEAIMKCE